MTITRKPKNNQNASIANSDEKAVQAFISGAEKVEKETDKKAVIIRFDPELLNRIDAAAKRRGVSRVAWVQFTLSRALDQGEG